MANRFNKERLFGDIEKLSQEEHISDGRENVGLSREEKRRKRVREHYARQRYRAYGVDQNLTYGSVVYRETLISVFAVIFFALYVIMLAAGVAAIIYATRFSAVLTVAVAIAATVILLFPPLKRIIRRKRFMGKLGRLVESHGFTLYLYRNPLRSLWRDGGCSDFAVECGGRVYECMFFPCRRRLTVLRFEKPGRVSVVSGIVKSRLKEAMGLRARVRERDFGFEPRIPAGGHTVVKVVLLNPVPYRMYCLDRRDERVAEGGSGSEAFGYTFYNASGLLREIERCAEAEK